MEDVILEIFDALEIGGLRPPWAGRDEEAQRRMGRRALKMWSTLLSDQSPESLIAAAGALLRSGERFWPTPGTLLKYVPERQQAFPDGAALFEWVVGHCARGRLASQILDEAASLWGDRIRRPLRTGLASVGGAKGLGHAPICGSDGAILRASYAKRFVAAYRDAAERADQQERTGLSERAAQQLLAELGRRGGRLLGSGS